MGSVLKEALAGEEVLIMDRAKGRVSVRVTLAMALLFLIATIGRGQAQTPLGTAFTYQGQLQNNAVPENGSCDLQFKLFDAATGGSQIGSTVTDTGITITNGLFTVTLDFGAGAFAGSARWLEISVACPSGSGFTTLSPRQQLNPSPNALFASSAMVSTDGTTLTGNGTAGTPLGITANGVNTTQLANSAVTTGKLSATGSSSGQVLTSNGSAVSWQTPTGLSSVSHDATLTGNGTGGTPLGVAIPLSIFGNSANSLIAATNVGSGYGLFGLTSGTGSTAGVVGLGGATSGNSAPFVAGVWGDSSTGIGVLGTNGNSWGVWGSSVSGIGIYGASVHSTAIAGQTQSSTLGSAGVFGENASGSSGVSPVTVPGLLGSVHTGDGILGFSDDPMHAGTVGANLSNGYGIYGLSNVNGLAVYANGGFGGTGAKYFIEPHPSDPTREIRYVCLEGRESGTYFRGTAQLVNGFATIEVPEDFRIVTAEKGLTVQVTPVGDPALLYCVSKSLDKIVIRGSSDVEFDYMVNGVRRAFADFDPIFPNKVFIPATARDPNFTVGFPAETVRRLKNNGILKEDGSINLETAHRLGWDQREGWSTGSTSHQ
jgi:hypothetical protein